MRLHRLHRPRRLIPILITFCILLFTAYFLRSLPSPTTLGKSSAYPISTKILDRNGVLLYEIYDDQNRTPVTLASLPTFVREATIAIEDDNFYQHHGFDTGGILRAAWKTATGQRLEGGSTITQQLVKVALLSPERTLSRKLKEAVLTVATELLYNKDQILEMYLNHIPYGGTSYGIEAAAKRYFDTPAKDLTLAEAALLAGLPQAPSRYSPFSNPDQAKLRAKQVLSRMVEEKYITAEQATAANVDELHFAPPAEHIRAPHFVMYVREQLEQKYGTARLEQGGLRVTTSLDINLQEQAQASLSAELTKIARLKISNGAALITNPASGEILAMVGSRDYFDDSIDGKVNVTNRLRQPGSSIKPLNYALGLETKVITPSTMLLDTPICFRITGQPDYCPKNYDGSFHGPVQIRYALGNSYNIPAVKVLALNGVESFISFASKLGISSWHDPSAYGLSLTLGGGEVTMTDLATAFGVFANSGTKSPLHAILRVEDASGQVLDSYDASQATEAVQSARDALPSPDYPDKVLSPEVSFLISSILSDNGARVAAFGPSSVLNIPKKTVAVKTGTTNNLRDNWTVGYTPERLVAVWVGNNDNTPMSYVASGVTGASPIWQDLMKLALADLDDNPPYRPEHGTEIATVCQDSGTVPTPDRPCSGRSEYFVEGTVPTTSTITRRLLFVNRDTHNPPTREEEFANVEERDSLVGSDPFVTDYCLDCPPPPEGVTLPPTIVTYSLPINAPLPDSSE